MPARLAYSALLFLLLPVALIGAHVQSDAEPSRSVLSGVYSTAQATRGEETYMSFCVGCHPAGTYATAAFKTSWAGRPVSDLFEVVKDKMPKNDPGSLTPEEATQILAYLLKINDVPAGDTDLPPEVVELKKIRFETPAIRGLKAER